MATLASNGNHGKGGPTGRQEDVMSEQSGETRLATLAGGCFWCVQADLEKLPGITAVVSGYTGGSEPEADYELVCSGTTGHREAEIGRAHV